MDPYQLVTGRHHPPRTSGGRCRTLLAGAMLICIATSAAAAPASRSGAPLRELTERREVSSAALAREAPSTALGARLRVAGVAVPATSETLDLDVERFEVFAPDVEIVVHGNDGDRRLPRPRNVYFRGEVAGEAGSRVFLETMPNGRTRGIVARPGDHYYLIDNGDPEEPAAAGIAGPLQAERADAALLEPNDEPWQCDQDELPPVPNMTAARDLVAALTEEPTTAEAPVASMQAPQYTARIAIETDYEYYAKFNDATSATSYVADLIGYASMIFTREVNTSLVVQSVSLWTGGADSDPWNARDTGGALGEFSDYWNRNKASVPRTIAHFLSGKGLNGGVAFLGVLCSDTLGYAFTALISGTFNVNNPTVVWDIFAVAHEIGHNFNSPHTHSYCGIGGSSLPIDQCYWGCYGGPVSLPGPPGSGSGTIMSYCDLLPPYLSNISLNFGTGHPYGVLPERQAAHMRAHVAQQAAANPSCLAVLTNPPPTVVAVTPNSGHTDADTPVTITGSGFASGATVTFSSASDSVAAGNVVVVNATTITATAPPHPTGAVSVTVTNPDTLTGSRPNAFFYAPPPEASSFYTLTPCRVVDTRNVGGPFGGPALAAHSSRTFDLTGSCGIPDGALAVSANVTVVGAAAAGTVAFYPGNAFPFGTSTVAFRLGATRAAQTILQLATDGSGTVGVHNAASGANHLLIDVNGYFE